MIDDATCARFAAAVARHGPDEIAALLGALKDVLGDRWDALVRAPEPDSEWARWHVGNASEGAQRQLRNRLLDVRMVARGQDMATHTIPPCWVAAIDGVPLVHENGIVKVFYDMESAQYAAEKAVENP